MFFFNHKAPKNKNKKAASRNILPAVPSKSPYAEAFRTLRTNLFFSTIDKSVKSIVITSALQSEGKTNTTANMGYAIAGTGKKVLLVDSDLRKPFLTDIFDLKGKPGLTDLLVDALDHPVTRGSLSDFTLGDLLHLARFQNLTGELDLSSDPNMVRFHIKEGRIMDVVWQNRPPESGELALLVRDGILTRDAVATVMDIQKKTGQHVRSVLLSMGLVSREDLEKRLAIQAAEALKLASGVRNGSFSFTLSPWGATEPTAFPEMDFNALARELLNRDQDLAYIHQSIDRSVHETGTPNLWVMGAGKTPPNPSEIIGSERTETILGHLKRKFDFVIIDISPVLPASDAMLMAPRTDGILFVIRSGYANKKLVRQVIDQFRQSNLPVLGAVLNRVDVKRQPYYAPYYHGY